DVSGIEGVLHVGQVVRVDNGLDLDQPIAILAGEYVVAREQRGGSGAHVYEQEAGHSLDLVSGQANRVLQHGPLGLEALLTAVAIGGPEPSVVGAAKCRVFDEPVVERASTVRAMLRHAA